MKRVGQIILYDKRNVINEDFNYILDNDVPGTICAQIIFADIPHGEWGLCGSILYGINDG